jgi:hypothetical protein
MSVGTAGHEVKESERGGAQQHQVVANIGLCKELTQSLRLRGSTAVLLCLG